MSTIKMTFARIDELKDLLAVIEREKPETVQRCVEIINAVIEGYQGALDYLVNAPDPDDKMGPE